MRRISRVLFLAICVSSTPLLAWDPTIHAAIFDAARQVSPVVESRYDPALLADVVAGLKEADPSDKDCLYHRSASGRKDAWVVAEGLLANLRNPNPMWTARQKARILGSYLHYVADVATPHIAVRQRLKTIPFDLAVFREKRPLREPVGADLRLRAIEALAAESGYEALPVAFRAAVNLTIEAMLLLPSRTGAEVEDRGPVLLVPIMFVTERISGRIVQSLRILHAGLHVLEWSVRPTPSGTMVRALVQNNLDFCVRHVFFRTGDWLGGVTVSLPPLSLTVVELPGPASSPDDVVTRFVPGDCPVEPGRASIPLSWRRIAVPEDNAMQFERIREYQPGDPAPEPFGKAFAVEYREADMSAMKGLEIPAFEARAANDKVDFSFRVRNRSEAKPKPFLLELEVGSTKRPVTELVELNVDITKLQVGAERTVQGTVPVKTHGEFTALRVFRISRERPQSARKKEVKW